MSNQFIFDRSIQIPTLYANQKLHSTQIFNVILSRVNANNICVRTTTVPSTRQVLWISLSGEMRSDTLGEETPILDNNNRYHNVSLSLRSGLNSWVTLLSINDVCLVFTEWVTWPVLCWVKTWAKLSLQRSINSLRVHIFGFGIKIWWTQMCDFNHSWLVTRPSKQNVRP